MELPPDLSLATSTIPYELVATSRIARHCWDVRRWSPANSLNGEVDFLYQKALAAESVAELEGVSSVSNQIKIRRKHGIDAKRQITTALHRHANIEASQIRVSVDDGKVILEGPSTLITSVVSLTRPSDQLAACAKSSITSR